MSRHFIIVDPSDDISLLLSQYLSMGWHDADIEEKTLDELAEAENIDADAIIITGTEPGDTLVNQLMEVLITVRAEARKNKHYDMADLVRDQLNTAGIVLEDLPDGTIWRRTN